MSPCRSSNRDRRRMDCIRSTPMDCPIVTTDFHDYEPIEDLNVVPIREESFAHNFPSPLVWPPLSACMYDIL